MADEPDETAPPPVPRAPDALPPSKGELPRFNEVDDLPTPDPEAQLINDEDLAWVDKQELSEEERERRRAKRDERRKQHQRKRRNRRILQVGGALAATFAVLFGFWFWWTFKDLERMPTSAGQGGQDTPGTNILLIGDNPLEPDATSIPGRGWRHAFRSSDLVMVLHLNRDNDTMFAVSIPSKSLLPIPEHDGQPGFEGQLDEAFERGGQDLYVKTIEELTGARMDRVVTLDMNGLREVIDEIGGVSVDVPAALPACEITAGPHRVFGEEALSYVALNPCMEGGDVTRVQRQQALLRLIMRDSVDTGKIANPFTLSKLLKATAGHLTLEEDFGWWSMFGQGWTMRGLRSTSTTFLTVPVAADPFSAGRDKVVLDPERDAELFEALRADRIADYLALNKDIVTQ